MNRVENFCVPTWNICNYLSYLPNDTMVYLYVFTFFEYVVVVWMDRIQTFVDYKHLEAKSIKPSTMILHHTVCKVKVLRAIHGVLNFLLNRLLFLKMIIL